MLGFDEVMTQQGPVEVLSQTEHSACPIGGECRALGPMATGSGEGKRYVRSQPWRIFALFGGAMSFTDGAALVRRRGELMQAAVPDAKVPCGCWIDDEAKLSAATRLKVT